MRPITSLLLTLALIGCRTGEEGIGASSAGLVVGDDDGDGYAEGDGDCDDASAATFPGAPERCDGLDNDCDGDTDEDVVDIWYGDVDEDGFGAPEFELPFCDPPPGFVANALDCDDGNPDAFPGNTEVCDEADNDCDAAVDEGVQTTFYRDMDADTHGNAASTTLACAAPSGYAAVAGDCNDAAASAFPGGTEVCDHLDNDCDGSADEWGTIGEVEWFLDGDADGAGTGDISTYACEAPGGFVDNMNDCDDTDPTAFLGGVEVCDGVDNDCDSIVDQVDDDGDGAVSAECAGGDDCDDGDPAIAPGAVETWVDGVDQDCGGGSDFDADADGHTTLASGGDDCNDALTAVHPGAAEVWYDGVDADCGANDDYDQDADGARHPSGGGADCDDTNPLRRPGLADAWYDGVDADCSGGSDFDRDGDGVDSDDHGGADCDDGNAAVFPGATEVWYDGVDQDCAGGSDYDADSDGELAEAHGGADCDDADAAVNPGAAEVCDDGIDNNCDGSPAGCGLWADLSVNAASTILRGAAAGDRLGQGDPGADAAGDVNGDGYGDLIVGALRNNGAGTQAGAAYIVFGPLSAGAGAVTAQADATIQGAAAGDNLGRGVAGVGDVDNDGYDDVLVAALGVDTGGTDAGAAYLFHGPISGTLSASAADATLVGAMASDIFAEVAWIGDVNSDGVDDFMVGAQMNSSYGPAAGAAYVFHGPVSGTIGATSADVQIYGEAFGDEAGSSNGGAGDLNGDGVNDLVIGARANDEGGTDAGAAYVVYGPVTASMTLGSADVKLMGEHAGAQIGWGVSISGAGDVNADGLDDLLIGARFDSTAASNAGGAYLVLGPPTEGSLAGADAKLLGEAAGDYTGDAVHGPGDIDGDGHDDLLIGSGYNDAGARNAGAVYLVRGPITGTFGLGAVADARFKGAGAEDRLRGHGVGDIDNDGLVDILVTAMNNDTAGTDAGAVYLFTGLGF